MRHSITMRHSVGILAAVVLFGLATGIANAAQSKAVQTMAGILINLHHFPSDSDKQALTQIAADKSTTADERTIAQALMDVQHTVAAADKPNLEAIVSNDKASSSDKTLADAILNLHHMVSDSDKAKLQALTQ
jgi:hypothetical protein